MEVLSVIGILFFIVWLFGWIIAYFTKPSGTSHPCRQISTFLTEINQLQVYILQIKFGQQ